MNKLCVNYKGPCKSGLCAVDDFGVLSTSVLRMPFPSALIGACA